MRAPGFAVIALSVLVSACGDERVTAAEAELRADASSLDFGPVFVGEVGTRAVGIRNLGRAETTVAVAATPPFSATPETLTLDAGATAALEIRFAPTMPGEVPGEVALRSTGGELSVAVTGRGVEYLVEVPRRLDFGSVPVGARVTRSLSIASRSEGTVRLEPRLAGDGAAAFEAPRAVSVPAGATVDLPVTYAPGSRGEHLPTLELRPCARCEPWLVQLAGRAVEENLGVSPREVDFGLVAPGERVTRSLVAQNAGAVASAVVAATLVQGPGGPFSLDTPALPASLETGGSMRIEVTFAPNAALEAEGVLRIDLGSSALDVPLRGRCLPALVTATPATLDFGVVAPGATVARTLTLSRLTDLAAAVERIEVTGAGFAATATLPAPLGPPLALEVTFTAGPEGLAEGLLRAISQPGNQALEVPLAATVLSGAPCVLDVSPPSLGFGLVSPGTVHRRAVTLVNRGATACAVWGFALDGGSESNFRIAAAPEDPASLPPGGSARVEVEYAPSAPRLLPEVAFLVVQRYPPGSEPVLVPVHGQAAAVGLQVLPDPLEFGEVSIGDRALAAVALVNGGPVPLRIDRVGLGPGAPAAFTPADLPPTPQTLGAGRVEDVHLAFAPEVPGPAAAELEVWLEGYGEPVLAGLAGTGSEGAGRDRPTASCPADRTMPVHSLVVLRGAGAGAAGEPVSCAWTVADAPTGATPWLEDPDSCRTAFRPDLIGVYRLALLVTDPAGGTDRCEVALDAEALPALWVETTWTVDADVDLHLLHPDGGDPGAGQGWFDPAHDCFFSSLWPYWDGPGRDDDPRLDRDVQFEFGPEAISLEAPADHPYLVGVHWFARLYGSGAQEVRTRIFCGGVLAADRTVVLGDPGRAAVLGSVTFTSPTSCDFTPDGRSVDLSASPVPP